MQRDFPGCTVPPGVEPHLERRNERIAERDLPRLRRKLLSYALREMRNADAAEDATQETMLALLLGPERHRVGALRDIYAIGVLRHKIADHFRAHKRETPMEPEPLDALRERACDSMETSPSLRDPSERLDAKRSSARFWRTLHTCLATLPEGTRSAFVLRDVQEWDMDAVSRHLGVTPTYVSVMTHRARAHLRAGWQAAERSPAAA